MVPDRCDPSRRALLRGGTLAALGLAGCMGSPGNTPSSTPTGTRTGTRTPADTDAPSPNGTPPAGDAVRWRYRAGGTIRNPPAVADGTVYVGGGTNDRATGSDRVRPETSENVYALDAADGTERWRYAAPAGVMSSPVVRGGVVVVVGWNAGLTGEAQRLVRVDGGTEMWATPPIDRYLVPLDVADGIAYLGTWNDALGVEGETLSAVRVADGSERWSVGAGDAMDGTVHGDALYAVEGGRRTTAFATGDGRERWHRDMRPADGDPDVTGGTLYLEAEQENADGNYPVVAVAAADGAERWRYAAPVDEPFVPTGAVATDGAVYVTEYDGWLFALDPADGSERWRRSFGGDTREPPAYASGTVYLAGVDGSVHAVDGETGDPRWTRTFHGPAHLAAANGEGIVVRGGKNGRWLRALVHDGAERWSFAPGREMTKPAVTGTRAYVGTGDGHVVALGE